MNSNNIPEKNKCSTYSDTNDLPIPKTETNTKTENGKSSKKEHRKNKVPKNFNSNHLVVFFTFLLAVATFWLGLETWSLAKTGERQIELTKQNISIENAPYFIIHLKISPMPKPEDKYYAHATYINVGKTPAINAKKVLIFSFNQNDNISKISIINDSSHIFNNGLVPPTDSVWQDLYSTYNFSDDNIRKIKSGKIVFSINAGIKYQSLRRIIFEIY